MSILQGSWACPACGEHVAVVAVRGPAPVAWVAQPDGSLSEVTEPGSPAPGGPPRYRCSACLAAFGAPVRRQRVWYA